MRIHISQRKKQLIVPRPLGYRWRRQHRYGD